jgi:hypothetical protein
VAHEQDPRRYPYGYLTGGSDELASVRVFVWFQTLDEMIESLLDEFLGEERRGQLLPEGHDTAFIDFLRPPAC